MHQFWDTQPVSREKETPEGIIAKPKYVYTNANTIPEEYRWKHITNIHAFQKFLNENYAKNQIYSLDFLHWFIQTPHQHITKIAQLERNRFNICLTTEKGNIIGTICGQPMILFINRRIVEAIYVDFLCLRKDLRNQRLAPQLIYKILELWKNSRLDLLIFKIDEKPLPFNYLAEYTYYHYDLGENNPPILTTKFVEKLNKFNLEEIFKYITEQIAKYDLYQSYSTLTEFKHHFSYPIIAYFIRDLEDGSVNSFASFIRTQYRDNNNKLVNAIELQYFFGEEQLIFEYLWKINQSANIKADVLIFTDQYTRLVSLLQPAEKGHKTYLHLYNYHANVEKEKIIVPII